MLDFFAVITKGGLVLWYFQDAAQRLDASISAINALIKNVVLQVSTHWNICLLIKWIIFFCIKFLKGKILLLIIIIAEYVSLAFMEFFCY